MPDFFFCQRNTLANLYANCNRPYALTSRLHNNDAMLGVKTCRAARTCCAGRAHQPISQCAARASPPSPAVWHAGVGPAGCMLGDVPRGSASFDPQHTWAPFCDVICIWSMEKNIAGLSRVFAVKNSGKSFMQRGQVMAKTL